MKIRHISKCEIDADPYCVWNAFVNLLAMECYRDLSPEQRPAHLVFWYENEVQNGGHLQYFENRGTEHVPETIEALGLLGADCQKLVLQDAYQVWLSHSRPKIQSVEEYCDAALSGEFDAFDLRFGQCETPLMNILEIYLNQRQTAFVKIS